MPSILFPFPSLTGSEMGNWGLGLRCAQFAAQACAGPLQAAAKTNGCCAVGQGQPGSPGLGPVRTREPTSSARGHAALFCKAHSYSLQNNCRIV